MIRKLVSLLFAVAVVLLTGTPSNAAQRYGSIQIALDVGELPVTNGAITLYQVGDPIPNGYRITEEFGGGMVKQEDALSSYLAKWLEESAGGTGKTVNLDVDGKVNFSNLEPGLYLLVQTERTDGFYPIPSLMAEIPQEGQKEIQLYPPTAPIIAENPQTGQPIAPLLGAMGLVASGVGLYLCIDGKRRK